MRNWAAYLALRAAVAFTGVLPEPVMRRLGRAAGTVWWLVDSRRRRFASRHMARLGAPRSAVREVFASYGRYWAESFWVRPARFAQMRRVMSVDGLDNLASARAGGKGVILALPHLGNWEAAALIGADVNLPVVAVAEKLANRRITDWFTRQRSMFGIEVVLTGSGRSSRRRLIEALDEGKGVALLCDRDLSGRGVTVEFCGEKTTLPAGPASLALRTGTEILPVGMYFRHGPGYHAIIAPPVSARLARPLNVGSSASGPEASERRSDHGIATLTQALAEGLEDLIRREPGQWHLLQPNWPSDEV